MIDPEPARRIRASACRRLGLLLDVQERPLGPVPHDRGLDRHGLELDVADLVQRRHEHLERSGLMSFIGLRAMLCSAA